MWADGQLPAGPGGALGPATGELGLIITPSPFARLDETVRATIPAGETIAGLLERAAAEGLLDAATIPWLRVSIGPHLILPATWARVRPKPGQVMLITAQPMDGGSVKAILQLAVVALATYVGFVVGGPLGALAAAAITIGGNLIINALIPPIQPKTQDRTARYSLDGASNTATPHAPVPIVLGKRRIYPPRCANYYTVMVGQDIYLRCLFQPSVGWVDREAVKIGETLISAYDGVTIGWHTRADDSAVLNHFGTTPAEDALALPVTAASGWVTRSTPIAGTRISLDLGFLSGLYHVDNRGSTQSRTVRVAVRYGAPGVDPASATAAPIGTGGVLTFTLATLDSYRQTFEWTVPLGMYDVHVERTTADTTDTSTSDKLTWVVLRAFHPAPALPAAATTPWIELEIKASEQLSGVLDTFNFVATSMVPQVTASGEAGGFIATRNPADLYAALSYPPFSDLDLDADERVFPDLVDWRTLCAAQGWNCDIVETGETSIGELLMRVAACGRARPSVDFGALTVMVDWVKPAPRQMFAARNVEKFKGALVYPEELHGLRMRFPNAAKLYADDSVTVWAPGFNAGNATRYDSVELRDIVDVVAVEREAQRIIAERIARPETFTFDQDIESIVVRDGERAWLSHPVALIGQVSARVMAVVSRVEGSSTRHGIRLDELVTIEAGKIYGIAWRRGVAALISAEVLSNVGTDFTVWFAAEPSILPQPGDLASFGERLIETLDVVVDRITPKPGLRAEISCVAYAPELQTLGTTPVTSARTALSVPPGVNSTFIVKRDDASRDAMLAQLVAILAAIGALAGDAAATADGKVQTYYQPSPPATGGAVDLGVGDLWFDSDEGNKQYRWSGTAWVPAQDTSIGTAITAAAGAQATADGKVTTFFSEVAPTAEGVGDLWYKASIKTLSRWSGSAWIPASPINVGDGATRNVPRGNYDAGMAYAYGDTVIYSGSTYQLIVANSTGNPPTDATRWVVVAAAGAGVPGATGPAGATLYTWVAYANAPDGSLDFTTGTPGGRAFQGLAVNQTTATEGSNAAAYTWGPYVGPPSYGLVGRGVQIAGTTIIKGLSQPTGWNVDCYSSETFIGGAFVTWTSGQTNANVMVGLNSDPTTDASFISLDFAWYAASNGSAYIYEGGYQVGGPVAGYGASEFGVQYDAKGFVHYYLNGLIFATRSAPADLAVYLDSSINEPGARFSIIGFGAAAKTGQDGAPGTAGVPGAPGANGAPTYIWIAYANSYDGLIDFTTGVPAGRAYQGIASNKSTATESTNPADYQWNSYAGPSAYGLIGQNAYIAGSTIIKNPAAGDNWNAGAYSDTGFKDGAFVSFQAVAPFTDTIIVGLNDDPAANASFVGILASFYLGPSGDYYDLRINNTTIGGGGTWLGGWTWLIQYDGTTGNIYWFINGGQVGAYYVGSGLTLYLDSTIFNANGRIQILGYGPAAKSGVSGSPGAAGTPGTNGTNGVNGTNGAPGAPGSSAVVQGSADGFSFHTGITTGDIYARFSNDSGASFGAPVRIKGDQGPGGGSITTTGAAVPYYVASGGSRQYTVQVGAQAAGSGSFRAQLTVDGSVYASASAPTGFNTDGPAQSFLQDTFTNSGPGKVFSFGLQRSSTGSGFTLDPSQTYLSV